MTIVKENILRYLGFALLGLLSAGGSMTIAYLINTIINKYFSETPVQSSIYFYYFIIALVVFFVSRWFVSFGIIGLTQNVLRKTRLEILQMVLRSPYYSVINKKEKIYTAMTRDAANIVQASVSVVDIITNGIIGIICFVYMAVLSWKLFLAMLVLLLFTISVYALGIKKQFGYFGKAMSHDDKFVKYLNEILQGFKEIVIDRKKGVGIEKKQIRGAIDSSVVYNKKAHVLNLNNRVIGQVSFYLFIGMLLLFLGSALDVSNKIIVNFVFLVLYVFGPIETVVVLIPALSQANASLTRLRSLREGLKATDMEIIEETTISEFRNLVAEDIFYEYKDEKTGDTLFQVGPSDFKITSGEVIFIFGGNGSGKTTFINMLIGLFPYEKGRILINDVQIENTQTYSYRSFFAPVFSDFHLFDQCYGIKQFDPEKAKLYLEMFELNNKVSVENDGFTTIDLSAGQRKRLALICAMLEKKPVLVLDEFAADQDPYFRKKFYLEILEFIRKEGFTVIAVTHDDHYYNFCDRLYKMDLGRIMTVNTAKVDLFDSKLLLQ